MNKNPFVPQPSYTPHQPPLPPGPPPPPPTDYAYWNQPQAAQIGQPAPPSVGNYNQAWTPPQPARPPEQNALFANYGYGQNWNQAQRQQQQQAPPQPQPQQYPMVQPALPQTQPGYNPYQPQAGYPQPYIPPQNGQPMPMQQPYQQHQPPPQFFPQQPQQQQVQQQNRQQLHHTPPQNMPPAKRQRFDGPNHGHPSPNNRMTPSQPQFPASVQPGGPSFNGPPQGPSRGGIPSGPSHRGNNNGNMNASRGRGMPMNQNNNNRGGGMGMGRGSGRGGYNNNSQNNMNNSSNRGGGPPAPLRPHGSRGNFGGGGGGSSQNRRGGGSFTNGSSSFNSNNNNNNNSLRQGSSFRGRGGYSNSSARGMRHDGGSFGSRDGAMNSSFGSNGKRDENRRSLTDFKIVGLEIKELDWNWGAIPAPVVKIEDLSDETLVPEASVESSTDVKKEEASSSVTTTTADDGLPVKPPTVDEATNPAIAPSGPKDSPPPSRIRIYFHTPVSADDSRPIPHSSDTHPHALPSDSRKGKRKKLDDDDGDMEEQQRRAPPPPPQSSSGITAANIAAATANSNSAVPTTEDRSSMAPSVAPSAASEGDWLMAGLMVENAGTDVGGDTEDEDGDDQLHVSQIVTANGDVDTDDEDEPRDAVGADTDMMGSQILSADVDSTAVVATASSEETQDAIVKDGSTAVVGTKAKAETSVVDDAKKTKKKEDETDEQASLVTVPPPAVNDTVSENVLPAPAQEQPADKPVGLLLPDSQVTSDAETASQSQHTLEPTPAASSQQSTAVDSTAQSQNTVVSSEEDTAKAIKTEASSQGVTSGTDGPPVALSSQPTLKTNTEAVPKSDTQVVSTPQTATAAARGPSPTPNRISIAYAAGNRRLVIDASAIEQLTVYRKQARIEIGIKLEKEPRTKLGLKGIFIEGLSEVTRLYLPLETLSDAYLKDETLPPFAKAAIPSSITMVIHLDTLRPLSEPKWVKFGDVQEWLKSECEERMVWPAAADTANGWEKKILVVDPDPPPTIWTVLDGWAANINSNVGSPTERHRFLKTHMADNMDHVLEVLLRLVRREGASFATNSQSAAPISASSLSGPLLAAFTPGAAHAAQQTHVSLAVLAMFRMSLDYAKSALGDAKGKKEVEARVGEIIRCLPSHLIYTSLDSIFKEWRVEKKGR